VFARNATWVIPNIIDADPVHPSGMKAAAAGKHRYAEEEKALFRNDPELFLKYRKKLEAGLILLFPVFQRGTPTNVFFRKTMEDMTNHRLGDGNDELKVFFIPNWSPGCWRITVFLPQHYKAFSTDEVKCSHLIPFWKPYSSLVR